MFYANFNNTKNITSIFRPWDDENSQRTEKNGHSTDVRVSRITTPPPTQSYQDCTISTTTNTEEHNCDESKSILEQNDMKQCNEIIVPLAPITFSKQKDIYDNEKKSSSISNKSCDKDNKKFKNKALSKTNYYSHSYETNLDAYQRNEFFYPSFNEIYNLQTMSAHQPTNGITDPIFLDTLAHNYAMEEYVRILNHEQQVKLLNSRKQRPKKYKCPHCDVGFSNNGQLKGHIRIHTGERPFRCDEKNCGKTFTRNEELTRHKRIHSGLRPFPCSACGKRFGRKDHLKKHTRTHTAASTRNALQLVPVVLPAGAWASIPPTSGVPMYNPSTVLAATAAATTSFSLHHPAHLPPTQTQSMLNVYESR